MSTRECERCSAPLADDDGELCEWCTWFRGEERRRAVAATGSHNTRQRKAHKPAASIRVFADPGRASAAG